MIAETLITGATLLGSVGCWAAVQKHRLTVELQKHKINVDMEVLKPVPEPVLPPPTQPAEQSLKELLSRRRNLENHITSLRERASDSRFSDKSYAQYRADALKALEDARQQQQELVAEEGRLLEMLQGENKNAKELDSTKKSAQPDPGRPVVTSTRERVDDPGELHVAELHDEKTGGKGPARVLEEVART